MGLYKLSSVKAAGNVDKQKNAVHNEHNTIRLELYFVAECASNTPGRFHAELPSDQSSAEYFAKSISTEIQIRVI